MQQNLIALVTGANKGIGLETARQLGQRGVSVIVGARNADRGTQAVRELRAEGIEATFVELEVSDETSIAAAAQHIQDAHGHLDILVNNVGIWNIKDDGPPTSASPAVIRETMETNFVAMVAVTQAMLPLLRRPSVARIVNLSSTLGSLDANSDPSNPYYASRLLAYNASKAAVNMFTVQLAQELKDTGICVNAVSPGFVKTDLTGGQGLAGAADGARAPVKYALLEDGVVSGRFVDINGEIPW